MINVGIIFGGKSSEHKVSILSAINIFQALESKENKKCFKVKCFYINKEGIWLSNEESMRLLTEHDNNKNLSFNNNNNQSFEVLSSQIKEIDIWFPITHGPNGEDGTIQGLLKLTGKPFIGSGVIGSALGMDKLIMKSLFHLGGLPQVKYIGTSTNEIKKRGLSHISKLIDKKLKYPIFVKPANLGSSIGITKVLDRNGLKHALEHASNYDEKIVIENSIKGLELECGVIGKNKLEASVVGQVNINTDWYDYESKYKNQLNEIVIPAEINKDVSKKIRALAIKACETLNVYGLARVDFFYEETTSNIYINEINTLPGFTKKSMFPMLWANTGIKVDELISKLIKMALANE
tara:strand:- start:3645 stop:4694 length:1050 start_codon:yes stop_codon:yes gene_type:complete